MKRSSNVKRSSMDKSLKLGKIIPFAAFGGIFFLATQESKTEGYIFSDADECKSNSPEFSEQCDIAYQEALARAERNAPRYNNEFECENDFLRRRLLLQLKLSCLCPSFWRLFL